MAAASAVGPDARPHVRLEHRGHEEVDRVAQDQHPGADARNRSLDEPLDRKGELR
jgi:hypothetical protein